MLSTWYWLPGRHQNNPPPPPPKSSAAAANRRPHPVRPADPLTERRSRLPSHIPSPLPAADATHSGQPHGARLPRPPAVSSPAHTVGVCTRPRVLTRSRGRPLWDVSVQAQDRGSLLQKCRQVAGRVDRRHPAPWLLQRREGRSGRGGCLLPSSSLRGSY